MIKETEKNIDNVQHTANQLEESFNSSDVKNVKRGKGKEKTKKTDQN